MKASKAPNPICQSCAMPMEVPRQFGTEAGDAASREYCCYCYQQGKFTADLSLKQMQDKLIALALERKFMPEAEARKLAEAVLPKLKRWAPGNLKAVRRRIFVITILLGLLVAATPLAGALEGRQLDRLAILLMAGAGAAIAGLGLLFLLRGELSSAPPPTIETKGDAHA